MYTYFVDVLQVNMSTSELLMPKQAGKFIAEHSKHVSILDDGVKKTAKIVSNNSTYRNTLHTCAIPTYFILERNVFMHKICSIYIISYLLHRAVGTSLYKFYVVELPQRYRTSI